MQEAVHGLEPEAIWRHFSDLSEIPRPSGKEQAACDYVRKVAEANGLAHEADEFGNVLVRKPGTAGFEGSPGVVIQGHLDMVCQANSDSSHDFEKDPIRLLREDEWLTADGTTLGADNGIGCAFAFALMEAKDLEHPPLEFLFTLEEETGLCGASALGFELQGTRLLNIDSEEDGVITVGCAGGRDTNGVVPVEREDLGAGRELVRIALRGLKGGHSGCDIHLQRGNGIRLLVRVLLQVHEEFGLRLVSLEGGTAHNAIPREAFALVSLPAGRREELKARLEGEITATLAHEFRSSDAGVKVSCGEGKDPGYGALTEASERRLLDLVMAIPHGVAAQSLEVPGLVETSSNLAIVRTEAGVVRVRTSQRSSSPSRMVGICEQVDACLRLAGAEISHGNGYPGWEPNLGSQLLEILKQVMERVVGEPPEVGAIHAGLECGIIGERYPRLEMASIGPTIRGAHSPDERLRIPSVQLLWDVVLETLKALK